MKYFLKSSTFILCNILIINQKIYIFLNHQRVQYEAPDPNQNLLIIDVVAEMCLTKEIKNKRSFIKFERGEKAESKIT